MKNTLIFNEFTRECLARYMDLDTRKAPSIILRGPSGMGKSYMGLQIVRHLLGFDGNLEMHPDFLCIKPENGIITKASTEDILSHIGMRAVAADRKVIFVEDAECMNDAAANSILKALEDGHKQIVFVFSAACGLLDTIQSRCMEILFYPVEKTQVQKWERSQGRELHETAWMLCNGRIGIYEKYKDNTKYLERVSCFFDALLHGSRKDVLESAGAMREKDSGYFYDAFSLEEIEGWIQGILYILSEAACSNEHPIFKKYATSDIVLIAEFLTEKKHLLFTKGMFTRNDFFDLLHLIVKLRKEVAA